MPLNNGVWQYTETETVSPTWSEHLNKLGDSVRTAIAAVPPPDTGWLPVATVPGVTVVQRVECRKIGSEVTWRGQVSGTFTLAGITVAAPGAVPVSCRPTTSYRDTGCTLGSTDSLQHPTATVGTDGALVIRNSVNETPGSVYLSGLRYLTS